MNDDILNSDFNLAIDTLKRGNIIAAQTDTVYSILADATNEIAIKRVYRIKERPLTKPLIVLVSSLEMAKTIAFISTELEEILKTLWLKRTYPITVILPAKDTVSKLITASGDTIALRLPNDQFCINLINTLGKPIIATKAKISDHDTPTCYDDVKKEFDGLIPIIKSDKRSHSTDIIVDLSKQTASMVRFGTLSQEMLEKHFQCIEFNDLLTYFPENNKRDLNKKSGFMKVLFCSAFLIKIIICLALALLTLLVFNTKSMTVSCSEEVNCNLGITLQQSLK